MAKRSKPTKKPAAPQVEATATRCPDCGSTDRGPYFAKTVQEYGGFSDGKPHTHIVRRRTVCQACGQCRVDRSYENRAQVPAAPTDQGETK